MVPVREAALIMMPPTTWIRYTEVMRMALLTLAALTLCRLKRDGRDAFIPMLAFDKPPLFHNAVVRIGTN
jgi:hypothetical protein